MFVYVMLIFFVMDGEPVAQARIMPSFDRCMAEGRAIFRDMAADPLISHTLINCIERGPFPRRQPT